MGKPATLVPGARYADVDSRRAAFRALQLVQEMDEDAAAFGAGRTTAPELPIAGWLSLEPESKSAPESELASGHRRT